MVVAATALSVVPLALSLLMPDWYLGDQQNAVEDVERVGRTSRRAARVRGGDE